MGSVLRYRHGPSRRAPARSGRLRSTVVSRGFSAPVVVIRTCCPVLRGRAREGSLFELFFVGTWSARAREPGL